MVESNRDTMKTSLSRTQQYLIYIKSTLIFTGKSIEKSRLCDIKLVRKKSIEPSDSARLETFLVPLVAGATLVV